LIYLDTSVALAQILGEDRFPPEELWSESVVASRLLEYELWTRVHARDLGKTHGEAVRDLVQHLAFLELTPVILARALDPFPISLRTLDALHLASISFLLGKGISVELVSYDERMLAAARKLKMPISAYSAA
jgi:hypothetical protein